MPDFKSDLNQEQILNNYLDEVYKSKQLKFTRVTNLKKQRLGIDLVIHHNDVDYYIDEKAQLHYLNQDLPTFTFELSYRNKTNKIKEGWLFDPLKSTHFYFLVTGIILKNNQSKLLAPNDIKSLKITSVNRKKLIEHLQQKGLSRHKLDQYDCDIRHTQSFGKNFIPELNHKSAGLIYYSNHLTEQPLNLQLRLEYLINCKVAKAFHL